MHELSFNNKFLIFLLKLLDLMKWLTVTVGHKKLKIQRND